MIKHIVFFKVAAPLSAAEKASLLNTVSQRLNELPGLIPEISRFEVGINMVDDIKAADLVLVSEFESAGALQSYQSHPAHQAFLMWNKDKCPKFSVVDYLF